MTRALVIGAAALSAIGGATGWIAAGDRHVMVQGSLAPLSACTVTDGDTIRCDGERIRLLGIDAPELPGHCVEGRDCAPGDPYASTNTLNDALSQPLSVERVGVDRYGRTLAMVSGAKGDLSCWQLAHHTAIYKPRWDNGGRVAAMCPNSTSGG